MRHKKRQQKIIGGRGIKVYQQTLIKTGNSEDTVICIQVWENIYSNIIL